MRIFSLIRISNYILIDAYLMSPLSFSLGMISVDALKGVLSALLTFRISRGSFMRMSTVVMASREELETGKISISSRPTNFKSPEYISSVNLIAQRLLTELWILPHLHSASPSWVTYCTQIEWPIIFHGVNFNWRKKHELTPHGVYIHSGALLGVGCMASQHWTDFHNQGCMLNDLVKITVCISHVRTTWSPGNIISYIWFYLLI